MEFERPNDFIGCFLREIDLHKNSDKADIYCVDQLVVLISDLFQAGVDATSLALESAAMFMIKFPKVQKKIQQEIDNVLGHKGSAPNPDHRELYFLCNLASPKTGGL